jgi:hypothetical protein
MKWKYKLANKLLAFFVKILYFKNITDEATAFKMFKKKVLENINLKSSTFEYCPEITAKLLNRNYKIIEVPVNYVPRSDLSGKKIKWYDAIEAFYTLIKYKFIELS